MADERGDNLLCDDHPLQVLPSLAAEVGLNQALALQQVHYWLRKKIKDGTGHFEGGHFWVYNSFEDWQKQFPFWSVSTVKRVFYGLKEAGLLYLEQRRQSTFDHRNWASVNYEALANLGFSLPDNDINNRLIGNDHSINLSCINRSCQNEPIERTMPISSERVKMNQSPTETTTEITTETITHSPAAHGEGEAQVPKSTRKTPKPPTPNKQKRDELFEFVLGAVFNIQYKPHMKLSRDTRGRANAIAGALIDVGATPKLCAKALSWHVNGRGDGSGKKLSRPTTGAAWAAMIAEYQDSKSQKRETRYVGFDSEEEVQAAYERTVALYDTGPNPDALAAYRAIMNGEDVA